jgi:ADP-glucose pyrophosphorylase
MEGAAVRNSIIMPGVTIEKDSTIEYAIIAADTVV